MFESLKKKLKSIFSFSKEESAQETHPEERKEPEPMPQPLKVPEIIPEKTEEIKELTEAPESDGKTEEKIEISEEPAIEEKTKKSLFSKAVSRITEKKLGEKEAEEIFGNLKTVLLENDVAYEVAEKICDEVKNAIVGTSVGRSKTQDVLKNALAHSLKNIMTREKIDLEKLIDAKEGAYLMLVFGTNGAGKTTTIAKLAHKFRKFRPVVAAADTFRAASIEQLQEHSKKAGFDLVKHSYGADPAAVIFDARKHAEARKSKLIIGDTAGRSHSNANLMDELKKVARVNKPDLKILILDSLTGNDIYEQAKIYDHAIGVDAIILTKTDVYDKGGACLSASYVTGKPILYLGSGQKYGDLDDFDPDAIIAKMLD
ncbi:MAG: signal recognition particle-docking protein FtsY [Candidatus Aenigmarchaeota archaeon]|nr:signal recognition particle-docking protein FtsY [Candidatus Aenigmarchaeota archaeon]